MIDIHVHVLGDKEIEAAFADSPKRAAVMRQAMDAHLGAIHDRVVPLTPVFTGTLRGSWSTQVSGSGTHVVGVLGSPLIYAAVMEEGRTPGAQMPPPDAIAAWVAAKMGGTVSAFVVARSIGIKGIRGRHMLLRAIEETRPIVQSIWDAATEALIP
ncbi:MAG: hypothetical protein ACJ76P_04900 [Actinomycetota bacterium]